MSYEDFKSEYKRIFKLMLKYNPKQAGFGVYTEMLSELCESNPEFEEMAEEEFFQERS